MRGGRRPRAVQPQRDRPRLPRPRGRGRWRAGSRVQRPPAADRRRAAVARTRRRRGRRGHVRRGRMARDARPAPRGVSVRNRADSSASGSTAGSMPPSNSVPSCGTGSPNSGSAAARRLARRRPPRRRPSRGSARMAVVTVGSPRRRRLLQLGIGAVLVVALAVTVGAGPFLRGLAAVSPQAIVAAVLFDRRGDRGGCLALAHGRRGSRPAAAMDRRGGGLLPFAVPERCAPRRHHRRRAPRLRPRATSGRRPAGRPCGRDRKDRRSGRPARSGRGGAAVAGAHVAVAGHGVDRRSRRCGPGARDRRGGTDPEGEACDRPRGEHGATDPRRAARIRRDRVVVDPGRRVSGGHVRGGLPCRGRAGHAARPDRAGVDRPVGGSAADQRRPDGVRARPRPPRRSRSSAWARMSGSRCRRRSAC